MTPEELTAMMRGAQKKAEEEVVRDFTASYESECPDCGETILPGDEAGYIGDTDQASCSDCIRSAKSA